MIKDFDQFKSEMVLTEDDIIAAAQYGMWYALNSQHSGEVPKGNVLQWLYSRKGYYDIPDQKKKENE